MAEETTTTKKEKHEKLPDTPWTYASLVERYGAEGGEEAYCRIAEKNGHFNARADRGFRPDLHP